MTINKLTLMTCMGLVSAPVLATSQLDYEIANWKGFQDAAVVLAFDDYSPGQKDIAIPQLIKRDMAATIFVTTDTAEWLGWDTIIEGHNAGIEMANHTVLHHDFNYDYIDWQGITRPPVGPDRYDDEVKVASDRIEANTGKRPTTFAFPFGSYNRSIQQYLHDTGFIAARGWDPAKYVVNPYDFATSEGAYYELSSTNAYILQDLEKFEFVLDFALDSGGLYILTWHSIVGPDGGADWSEVVPQGIFENQLDIVKSKDDAWVTTLEKAIKYHRQKAVAEVELVSVDAKAMTLNLKDGLADEVYDEPLTLKVKVPTQFGVSKVEQDGKVIRFKWDDQSIIFDAVPDRGDIIVHNW
ncbi:polysaccharide deacetylase [Vibrio nigripulchritudo ATCC 27043]|uniref:polysaccharide deacetylase family protein n=1 Tax=Vibrio nigripulchritudo TaxID=28173 RepID=UPI00021C1EC9|nr:polysaccharide deacetylase family protein [Vibrio nigripulchritudo]EGU61758.1 polysaccharide deacetylase [Vibrio nigripulchritudo ATCC 27043]